MNWKNLLLCACLTFTFFACEDDKPQFEKDIEKIQTYLAENNLTATQHSSGIFYSIETEGTGENPNRFATVIVKYKGRLLDGFLFDETVGNKTAQFSLTRTVRGFSVAATLLKRGGKGTFYLPSGLGYGRTEQGDIPRNSVLIFEIELIDFIN